MKRRIFPWLLLAMLVVLAGLVVLWSSRVGATLRLKFGYTIKNDRGCLDALTQMEKSETSVLRLTEVIRENSPCKSPTIGCPGNDQPAHGKASRRCKSVHSPESNI